MITKSLGDPIPGTSNLYAWGEGQILKLYDQDCPADWIKHIGQVDRALVQAGLPVPGVGELVEIGGCLGQVYERIDGGSMAEAMGTTQGDPDGIIDLATVFAEVQVQIHTYNHVAAEIPLQKELFPSVINRIDVLPADLKQATLQAFENIPGGDRLCHGDFHPFNVMMSPRGPVVIDWNNAHIGNPLEDVARSALILDGVSLSEPAFTPIADQFKQAYLDRYFQLVPGSKVQLDAWRPIVAAIRFADGIPELETWLLEQIRTGLVVHD